MFSTSGEPFAHPTRADIDVSRDQVGRINDTGRRLQADAIRAWNLLILLLVIARLAAIGTIPFRFLETPMLAFSGLGLLLLLLFSGAHPRYDLFLVLPYSYWIGQLLWPVRRSDPAPRWSWWALAGTGALGLVVGTFLLASWGLRHSGLALEDLTVAKTLTPGQARELGLGERRFATPSVASVFNQIDLGYAPGEYISEGSVIGASVTVAIDGRQRHVEFFVTTARDEFRKIHDIDGGPRPWEPYQLEYCVYLAKERACT